jgi:heme A synthase
MNCFIIRRCHYFLIFLTIIIYCGCRSPRRRRCFRRVVAVVLITAVVAITIAAVIVAVTAVVTITIAVVIVAVAAVVALAIALSSPSPLLSMILFRW